ncbi:MAG: hypothetical protein ACMV0I_03405, partial [Pseudomonas sp.]
MSTKAPNAGASDACARLTVFTSIKTLTKTYRVDFYTKKLKKDDKSGLMPSGEYATECVASVADLYALIQTLNPRQAISLGVADKPTGRITTTDKLKKGESNGAITRTKANFKPYEGAGFLFVDLDHHESKPYNNPAEAYQYLIERVPELSEAQALAIPSSSSYIYGADGREYNGFRGCHVYFLIKDSADLKRATDTLFDRLQLNNEGDTGAIRYDISTSGALLLRGRIDASVGSHERLIYAGGANLLNGATQRRDAYLYNQHAAPVDSISAIPDLSKEEAESLEKMRADAKIAARPAQLAFIERQPFIKQLPETERTAAVRDYIKRFDRGYLPVDTVLYFYDNTQKTGREILDAPHLYHGKRLRDPADPFHTNDTRIAQLYVSDDHVYI